VIATGISPELTKLLGPRLVYSSSSVDDEPDAEDKRDHHGDALGKGALVVAAGGNDGSDQPFFPASYSGVIAVGSVDASNKLAPFSDRWPGLLYAPGVNILAVGKDGGLAAHSGTSFSAAIVAAIAAVIWAAKPDWSAQQIRQLLIDTSIDLGPVDPTNSLLGKVRLIDVIAASRHAS
jgi:thermitase